MCGQNVEEQVQTVHLYSDVVARLNSKPICKPTASEPNCLPETLPTGLSVVVYGLETKNAPTEYGTILYVAYTSGSNKWYFAIANGTNNTGTWLNTKTNSSDWGSWQKISIIK